MNSLSEVRFEFPEMVPARAAGPLEKLWHAGDSSTTMFLSGQEVARREEEARARGVRETELRLTVEHERSMALLRAGVTGALTAFASERERYFRALEKEAVRLATEIARKVVGYELRQDPAVLLRKIAGVFARMGADAKCRIRVCPAEAAAWEKSVTANHAGEAIVVADATVGPGTCRIETPLGSTVLDPATELDSIEEAFSTLSAPEPLETSLAIVQ